MKRLSSFTLLAVLLCGTYFSLAQNYPRKNYDWDKNRKINYELYPDEPNVHAVTLLDRKFIDFTENEAYRSFNVYITDHTIIRVNDDKGVNDFKKVSIQLYSGDELIKLKVRTINQDGKIAEVEGDQIMLVDSSKDYRDYKIFALENIEVGSEVEYIYTLRRRSSRSLTIMQGTIYFQNHTEIKEAYFTLTCPSYLEIDTKSYNGFPDVATTEHNGTVTMYAAAHDIPAIQDERYSTPMANRMKVAYMVKRNKSNIYNEEYSWSNIVTNYYKTLGLSGFNYIAFHVPDDLVISDTSEEGKITSIENYIKRNIKYKEGSAPGEYSVSDVLTYRYANIWGLLQLYASLFKKLDIPFSLVVTSNRYETTFDPEFIDFQNLHEFLFYFPDGKKYISPKCWECRYGPPPYSLADNDAIVIASENAGRMAKISMPDVNSNKYRMDASVLIDTTMEFAEVRKTQLWEGYSATSIRGKYKLAGKEYEKDFLDKLAFSGSAKGDVLERHYENLDGDSLNSNMTAKLSTKFRSTDLIEHAGKDYILDVGRLIDRQNELYGRESRVNDIEMDYPQQFLRTIFIKIPKGYKVSGLEAIKVDKAFIENDARVCQFVSTYTADSQVVVIDVNEFYAATRYPKERYEDFRQVINAAADFSKLQLVMEKE